MFDLEKIKPEVKVLCQRLHVKRLDLFGSAATATLGAESDIDVVVEFDRQFGDLFNRYFELKEQLEVIFGRSVDVVVAEAIKNPYFRARVKESRKVIYADGTNRKIIADASPAPNRYTIIKYITPKTSISK